MEYLATGRKGTNRLFLLWHLRLYPTALVLIRALYLNQCVICLYANETKLVVVASFALSIGIPSAVLPSYPYYLLCSILVDES